MTTTTKTRSPLSDLPSEAFAARARINKVLKLADTLNMVGVSDSTGALMIMADPAAREATEKAAGIRPASDVTWGAAVLVIHDRATAGE